MHTILDRIIKLINSDEQIEHCRVNIINGCGNVFEKYKNNLSDLEDRDYISVRFYKDIPSLNHDLFGEEGFMSDNWFNLFVFNLNYANHICINTNSEHYNTETVTCKQPTYCIDAVCLDGKTLVKDKFLSEIKSIDSVLNEIGCRFDSKFYASTIVSMLPEEVIHQSFETMTGQECPIKSLRYLDFDFDGEEILTYMYKILKTHSTEFLCKWDSALQKLKDFTESTSVL